MKLSPLEIDEYQDRALDTAVYPEDPPLLYIALGIAGEAGEYVEKVKKRFRKVGNTYALTDEERVAMAKELGDLLWYIAVAGHELDYSLSEIAEMNLEKLRGRQTAGTLKGEGDDR